MPTFQKISADEAMTRRKEHLRETDRGQAVSKASKAPPSWDQAARSARFVMTTQQVDRYGDIVVTAGGDTTEFERNPVGLLFHSSRTWPVAKWDNLEKRTQGRPPRMEGDFVLLPSGGPVKEVDETAWMIENGGVRACSIGFIPNWDAVEMILDDEGKPTWGYRFNEWELVECSVCAVPANAGALVKSAGRDMQMAKELVEDVLDNWCRSPEGLLLPRAEFEATYQIVKGKGGSSNTTSAALPEPVENDLDGPSNDRASEVGSGAPEAAGGANTSSSEESREQRLVAPLMTFAMPADDEIEAFVKGVEKGDEFRVNLNDSGRAEIIRNGTSIRSFSVVGASGSQLVELSSKIADMDNAEFASGAPTNASTMTISVDTKDAEEGLSRVNGLLDRIGERFAAIFGRSKAPEPAVPELPTPEAIADALSRASAVRERAITKI